MILYESKRNEGLQAKIVEENEKTKTVILEYLTSENKGKTISVSISTFKRWWKKIEVEEENQAQEMSEAVEELVKDVPDEVEKACEELKVDSDTLDPIEKEKPKKVKIKKEKSLPLYSIENIIDVCKLKMFETKTYEKIKNMIVVKKDKKTKCEIRLQRNNIIISVKPETADVYGLENYEIQKNYYLPVNIKIDYNSNSLEIIKNILDLF